MLLKRPSGSEKTLPFAATARNGGRITPADELDYTPERHPYQFDKTVYARRVYNGFGHPQPETALIMGPTSRTGRKRMSWVKIFCLSLPPSFMTP